MLQETLVDWRMSPYPQQNNIAMHGLSSRQIANDVSGVRAGGAERC
jgi:hypothetical protein